MEYKDLDKFVESVLDDKEPTANLGLQLSDSEIDTLFEQSHRIEEFEEFITQIQEVMSAATRRKMKQAFKKNKAKIMRGRKKAAKRPQTQPGQIIKKAEKMARKTFEKKLLKGKSKSEIGMGGKVALEKQMAKKAGAIKKLAKKLKKIVLKKEKDKIKNKMAGRDKE